MRRTFLIAAASSMVTVLAVGVLGVVAVQRVGAAELWGAGMMGGPSMMAGHMLDGRKMPRLFEILRDVPPDERFEHVRSIELTIADKDGTQVVFSATLGTVASVSGSALTVDANDGTTPRFTINADTGFYGQAHSAGDLEAGDHVVVTAIDGATAASAVIEPGDHQGRWQRARRGSGN